MKIEPIKNGIVLDHIEAGKGAEVYNVLKLDELDCSVAVIRNAPSKNSCFDCSSGFTQISGK